MHKAKRFFGLSVISYQILQTGVHKFHENEESALSINHFEKIVLHLYDVGMIELRNDAQLSILVLWILNNLLQSILIMRSFVNNQVHLAESALAD